MSDSYREQVLSLLKERGVLRPRDLDARSIPHVYLNRLMEDGLLIRTQRGIYVPGHGEESEYFSLAEASKRVPGGVICLLSALRFHELGTQNPFQVWIAVDRKGWLPQSVTGIRVVRFSGSALTYGVVRHDIDGVSVPISSPAKTVADCFKYRGKIGLDIAIEALRDCWRHRKATMDELWEERRRFVGLPM